MPKNNVITAEPTKDNKKRIAIDVNEEFYIELYKKTRDDRTTVAEIARYFLEEYLNGTFKVAK